MACAMPVLWSISQLYHHSFVGTELYGLVTEAHGCEQLASSCYLIVT